MIYIEAPEYNLEAGLNGNKSIFLAGGIMQCPHWQDEIVELLKDTSLNVFNPRRKEFPMGDPNEETRQIAWEKNHLDAADLILYWFSPPTNNPIVFYELGRYIISSKDIFIGVDPAFERKNDVHIQVGLVRPHFKIVSTIQELAQQVVDYDNKDNKYRKYVTFPV